MERINRHNFFILLICLLFILAACAPKPGPKPAGPETAPKKQDETGIDQTAGEMTLVDILITEAGAYAARSEFRKALSRYNQALALAGEDRKQDLIEKAESVLPRLSFDEIRHFMDKEGATTQIPKPILLYWYGLSAALTEQKLAAQEIFENFLFEYADHPYAEDVVELLTTIRESLFTKNSIGVLLPLSGKYAIFGQRALNGVQMALKDLSEKYGTRFHLVIKDTKADPQTAVEGVRQLHEQNVAGIVGPWLTVTQAGIEAQKLQLPMIGLTQKSDFPLGGEYLFSNFISPEMQVRSLADYLFGQLGIKKAAILYPKEKYGEKYMHLFWDMVEEYNAQLVGAESYDGNKTDFSRAIKKLTGEYYEIPEEIKKVEEFRLIAAQEGVDEKDPAFFSMLKSFLENYEAADGQEEAAEEEDERIQIDFEALFIPDSPAKVSLILPQLAFNDATGMYLVGTNLWHNPALLKNAKGYIKKAVITDGFFGNSQNPVTSQFNEDYKHLYGSPPKFLEAIAYDCASILFTTAMDETVNTRSALKDALIQKLNYQGVTGDTVFDQDGRADRRLFLITIKKGGFVEISQ